MKKITLLLLMLLVSITSYSQLALEGFESGTLAPEPPPSTDWILGTGTWKVFDNGVGTVNRWGTNAAQVCSSTLTGYMRNENIGAGNTAEDYLSSPTFTVPANGELHFKTRSFTAGIQGGTTYQIKIAIASNDQLDPNSYILVQQWTEANLTAVFNVCEEKVVDLSAYAGFDVHVAFVMVLTQPTGSITGDRWLIDDISVNSKCLPPTGLTFSGLTQDGASLNWANPSGATSWEIWVVPAASGAPTGPGTIYNGALPYVVTGLLPNTAYKYYVRAICSPSGFPSELAGPSANFTTTTAPAECGGNYVDTGGSTANYSNNENSTTTIFPDTPGDLVTVTFTAFNTETGSDVLSVYDGPNTSAPLVGTYSGATLPPTFTSNSVDGSLTFVFVSNASTTSTGWIANVTCAPAPPCQQPINLTTTALLSTSVSLGWTNIGNATSWQVLALPCLSPAPTATTVGWTATATNPYLFTGLTPNTCYDLYVRGDCSSTSNGVSLWSGPKTVTTQIAPPVCGGNYFDSGGAGATGFYSNNENITTTICPTIAGQKVTVTFTAFNTEATFDGLYVYNGDTVTPTALLPSANGAGNVPGGLAGSYWGTTIPGPFTSTSADGCLTFVFRSDTSQTPLGWESNITCAFPPACQQPVSLTATLITTTTAQLGWTSPGTATSWQVIALPVGSPAPLPTETGWTAAPTNPFVLTGLIPGTAYEYYVRGDCGIVDGVSLWSGPRPFTTVPTCLQPTTLAATLATTNSVQLGWTSIAPSVSWQVIALTCGSPAPTAATTGWTEAATNPFVLTGLSPGTCYDFYVRGVCTPTDISFWSTLATATTQSLPPVCGGNFVDPGGITLNYDDDTDSTVTICPLVPTDQVTVTFTAFNTEANWDGLLVYEGATTGAPQILSANGFGNGFFATVPGAFWGTTIPGPFTSSNPDGCLTFRFVSDGTVNRPGWSANVTCTPQPPCLRPIGLTATGITFNSAVLSWISSGTLFNIEYGPVGFAQGTGTVITGVTNPYTLTGLNSVTQYSYYVQNNCGAVNGLSTWNGPFSFTTQPNYCAGDHFYDQGGVAGNYPNNANNTTTICSQTPGDILVVTFNTFAVENGVDFLNVYDGPDNTSQLIATYTGNNIPLAITSTSGCLTFVFTSNGFTQAAGWDATITCIPGPTCSRPSLVTATSITQTTATLTWNQPLNPDGTQATAWEVLVLPAGSPIPVTSGIPATSPYLASGLSPGVAYVFYVRAICSASDASFWAGRNFSTAPLNDECSNAIFAVVNQNLNCVQTTPGTITGATASNPVTTCPGSANDDVWFTFTATSVTHIISFNNVVPATALNYAIFTGADCNSLTEVGCNSGANLIPGTTYFIRVYSASANPQTTNFSLCIGTLPCTEAPAFCTGQTVTYDNATNVPSLGTIGCLNTSPNPAFFFLQVNQAGPLSYLISQVDTTGTPRDVDYVAWGPFTDLSTACSGVPASPLPGLFPALTPAQGCQGTLHACSYSINATEIMCIPAAQLCEVYVIMITNFSNQAGTVTFTQTNTGGGTTECFPINTFNYPQTYYCQDGVNPTPVLAPGAANGVYTSTPGLVIDSATGTIDLAVSTPGTYIVTSTTLTSTGGACTNIPSIITTRTVIITAPANATIAYSAPSFCNVITTLQSVTQTGTIGGTYTSSPPGLLINQFTGEILPIGSQPGNYTITYTILASGGCPAFPTSTTVEIIPAPIPTFTQVQPICPGDVLADLPTTSNNGITGTWSPSLNNLATTTYTFTPTTGICARPTTMIINVGSTTPLFTQVAPICPGAVLTDLPTTSNNGVTGTWSPALDNTITTTYTFTPTLGLCSGEVTMTIQVLPLTIEPTFNNVAPICPNGVIADLPTTSNNGITGVWSPALDNTTTTTYTFTPATAQCALTTTLTIIVNPELSVTVNSPTFCAGSTATVIATPTVPGTYSYSWTVPSGFPDPGNVDSFTTSTVGNYSVVITQVSSFCNTDFESPAATGAFPNLFNENLVPCWDTTSSDNIIEIWPPGFEGVTAYSGNQLIELNANLPGTLSQDFNVIPGTSISISFAHRGRQGNDVVGVEIGPVGGPYVSLGNFTDSNTAWVLHSVNYTIPMGSGSNYTLRFVSVSSTGGSPSIGNLLDAISISSLSCPSQPATGTVSLQTLPAPTVTVTQPTCAVQTGTIEVTSPTNSGGGTTPTDLFISEVTDESVGSLSYIEIYNGTGAAKDLSNYKLKVYNNGNNFTSTNCDITLSGILNNNDVYVIAVGENTNQGGVTPDLVFANCLAFNTNDNVRLTSNTDVEIDVWGRTDGINFTPSNQAGYTYRRLNTATIPSLTWIEADWTALDPQDYTNVGSYSLGGGYEYSLDTGSYGANTTFTGIAPGTHTITVHDLSTGCFSLPFSVIIDPVPQPPTFGNLTAATPICSGGDAVFTLSGTANATVTYTINTGAAQTVVLDATGNATVTINSVTTDTTILLSQISLATCNTTLNNSATVVVSPNPTFGNLTAATPICSGGDAVFTLSGTANATVTYTINTGATQTVVLDATGNATVTINAITTDTTILLSQISLATCNTTINNTATVVVSPNPTFGNLTAVTPICSGGDAVFTLSGTANATVTYSINTGATQTVVLDATGNATVTINAVTTDTTILLSQISLATCNTILSNTLTIIVDAGPQVTISGECVGPLYTLTASPIGNSFDPTSASYSWEDSAGNPIGSNSQSIVVTEQGDYFVTVTFNGCSGTATFTADTITCVIQKGISVNNTPDGLNDCFDLVGFNVKKLSIFNRYGMKVYTRNEYTNQWCGQSDNGDELPDGTYYYVIERDNGETKTGWIYINREN